MQTSWSFQESWNVALETKEERPLEPRERIWASEIGGAFIDRYLKMTAVIPTNPPNPRSRRKFEAGNMMEWIVKQVLKRAGILKEYGKWLKHEYPNLLPVTGKLDFLAGGKPDWKKAEAEIASLDLPEFFGRAMKAVVMHFETEYPEGLKEIIIEAKSCASTKYDQYENLGADPRHALQLFHYLKADQRDEGHIVYISKDDLRLLELGLFYPSAIEADYKRDIETMTHYIRSKEMPPKEPEMIFSEVTGKFSKNWKILYSPYLTMLYGYKEPYEFEERYDKLSGRLNRVLGRAVAGKKMTDNNKEAMEEIKTLGYNFEQCVETAKAKGIREEEAEENKEEKK